MSLLHMRDSAPKPFRRDWARHPDYPEWCDIAVFCLALGSLLAWLAGWLP